LVGDTSCLSIEPSIREAIETGPTARSLELPRTAYTRGGTKLESAYFVSRKRKSNQTLLYTSSKMKNTSQSELYFTHKDPLWEVDLLA